MEAKEILAKLKLAFNDLIAPPVAPVAPVATADTSKEYELKIGGTVTIDKLEAGGIVMIDGAPAVAGELELVDGTKITVTDNGVISAVTPGEVAPDPATDMGARFSSFETSTNEKFAAYEQRFADYEVKLGKATKVIDELLKLSQLIVEAPAAPADPAARTTNVFKEEKKDYSPILFN